MAPSYSKDITATLGGMHLQRYWLFCTKQRKNKEKVSKDSHSCDRWVRKWRGGEVEWFSKLLCVRAHAGTRRLLLSYYTSPLLHLKRQLFRSCLIGHLFFQLQRYNIFERNARFSPTTCPTFFRQIYFFSRLIIEKMNFFLISLLENLEVTEKVPIFASRKETISSRWNERVAP